MGLTKYKLGELITQRREKYDGVGELPSWGVSREGFISPKQEDADTSIYNVFYLNDFVFNPARMELNSIALNSQFEKAICSSLYEIFYVSRQDLVLPEYLNLFIKREEFARKCWYEAIGSARNYFRVANLSEFEIELPSIPIQQKYVDIYNAALKNQQCFERGLNDLKLVCDGYIDKLRHSMPHRKIGEYIEETNETNISNVYSLSDVKGISTDKVFIETKANMDGVSLSSYKIVNSHEFAYVSDTSRRGDKIALALNTNSKAVLISSIYTVFRVKDTNSILPEYLHLFFNRQEFDRYSRYNSWGSARETFDYEEMQNVQIPIPSIEEQKSIAEIFTLFGQRKDLNDRLKFQLKTLCPILIKGSIIEAEKQS